MITLHRRVYARILPTLLCMLACGRVHALELQSQLRNGATWFPNTITSPGAAIVVSGNRRYLPFSSGIGIQSLPDNTLKIIPFPGEESKHITGLFLLPDSLWAVSREGKILRFNPLNDTFTDAFQIHKSTAFGINGNLEAYFDRYRNRIWFSSFQNFDSYDIAKGEWKNHNDVFLRAKNGQPSSWHRVAITPDEIWISGGANIHTTGALLRCRPSNMDCVSYHTRLWDGQRLDLRDFLVSANYAWTIDHPGNLANTRIAEFNRRERSWSIFTSSQLVIPIRHLLSEIDTVTPSGPPAFAKQLNSASNLPDYFLKQENAPFSPEYLKALKIGITESLELLAESKRWNELENCHVAYSSNFAVCGRRIVANESGHLRDIGHIPTQISYKKIVYCAPDHALIDTSSGAIRLSAPQWNAEHISNVQLHFGEGAYKLFESSGNLIIAQYHDDGCGCVDTPTDYYQYSPNKHSIEKLPTFSESEEGMQLRDLPASCTFEENEIAVSGNGIVIKRRAPSPN